MQLPGSHTRSQLSVDALNANWTFNLVVCLPVPQLILENLATPSSLSLLALLSLTPSLPWLPSWLLFCGPSSETDDQVTRFHESWMPRVMQAFQSASKLNHKIWQCPTPVHSNHYRSKKMLYMYVYNDARAVFKLNHSIWLWLCSLFKTSWNSTLIRLVVRVTVWGSTI